MTSTADAAHVVIPAHQEEELLGCQLVAVRAALAHAARGRARLRTSVTVVLDDCDDGTAKLVRALAGVTALPVRLRCVGAARARGVLRARGHGSCRPETTWIACTDADSRVPEHWLSSQLDLAAGGADLVLGTVVPDDSHLDAERRQRWLGRHRLVDGHPHVHGANLGFRLSAYDAVGGFRALTVGEDADLATRMHAAGAHVVRTARHPVITSSRLEGRVPAGFASYLLAL
jgi:cellulose synthase/poly-beta-1,6-N-acetylglucosamine synthase-like glycosyltransferase